MKNISFMGAVYSDVPAVILPDAGGGVARFDDASITTATASDVASGKVFLASDGTITTGTSSGGGGASSWTKVCETSYQVNTTSTNPTTVATWATGHSEIWTSDKIVYVRVRDTAGKRAGYFYGSDNFFVITELKKYSSNQDGMRTAYRYTTSSAFASHSSTSTAGYGVYVDVVYRDGRIGIRGRYNSLYTLTIDGTYKVEVYLLDPAGGVPIFE